MALGLLDQLDVASSAWADDDFSVLSKMLTSPDSVTFAEQRTIAEKLGYKGSFLQAIVNIVADPTIWVAMMLSRKFPTSQYLRGVIPQRFIGTANEFTGLSTAARTVEGFFRGTTIPGLISLKMRREAEVTQIGNKIFDRLAVRPLWKTEMPIVSDLLEGQNPSGATLELRNLSTDIRLHMKELWGFLSKTQKVSGGFDNPNGITSATSRPFTNAEAPRFLRDYLPHIPLTGKESIITISGADALSGLSRGRIGQALQVAQEDPRRIWNVDSTGRLSSNYEKFQGFMDRVGAQVFNPRLFQRKRLGITLQSAEGQGLFVTDLNVILQRYIHSVARTYSLNAPLSERERSLVRTLIRDPSGVVKTLNPSSEPIITQVINEGIKASSPTGGIPFLQRPVLGTNVVESLVDRKLLNAPSLGALRTLVREFKGQADDSEALVGNLFNAVRAKISSGLAGRGIQKRQMDQIENALSSVQRDAQGRDMTRRITSYFYATTLGLNPASAMKNLFQPFLTTAPALGVGPTLAGYKVLKERIPRYAREFNVQRRLLEANKDIPIVPRLNLAQERAFERVFPELAGAGIKADPRAFELSEASLLTEAVTGRTKFSGLDAYNKFLLQPFTQTELSNQVVTFFGGKQALRQAMRRGELEIPLKVGTRSPLVGDDLNDFLNVQAASLVNSTQFRPGPGARTTLQTRIPPPFRQFTTFPIRLLNFFAESTVRGALTEAQLRESGFFTKLTGGRNLGTLARTYAAGRAITTGLRSALGVDVGDALGVTGPFTGIVESGRIFSPLTFSPLPSVMVGLASFSSTRDLRDLNPITLPVLGEIPVPKTLIPGGVAISRAVKAYRAYRPDMGGFVDDDERLMFRGDTRDAVLGMLGIPLEKERRMREALDRAQSNRFRVRQIRRKFAVASRNFDTSEMTRQQSIYAKEFPNLGTLGISAKDQRRYDEQANITATQRLIRSMGKRFNFLEEDLYEFDPDLVAGVPR